MMAIAGSVSQAAGQGGGNMQAGSSGSAMQVDPISKNLQNQITNAQRKLQDLSSDEEITPEEKMKRRQEIQQEIASLNQQLRQRQIDQKREERAKEQIKNEMPERTPKTDSEKTEIADSGLSKKSVHAMISADSSMKQAKVHENTAIQLDGKVNVLQEEIRLDSQRGQDTEKKQKELGKVQGRATAAATSQISTLGDANKVMKKASEEERKEKKVKDDGSLVMLKGDNVEKKKIGEYVSWDVRA